MPPPNQPIQKQESIVKLPTPQGEEQRYNRIVVFTMPDVERNEEINISGVDRAIAQHQAEIASLQQLRARILATP